MLLHRYPAGPHYPTPNNRPRSDGYRRRCDVRAWPAMR